jgi:RNA polymerase sigma factor (TIGR02999 family)
LEVPAKSEVTGLLLAWRSGDAAALERLVPLVYAELRRLAHRQMRGERVGHTLETSALVNETYLRLVDSQRVRWQGRAHFFAICAQLMRRVLVDHARSRRSLKRGGEAVSIALDDAQVGSASPDANLLALDEALTKLATVDPRKSRVVELRHFGGLSVVETAEALEVSPVTVMRDWRVAKLWLLRELERPATEARAGGA